MYAHAYHEFNLNKNDLLAFCTVLVRDQANFCINLLNLNYVGFAFTI